MIQPQRIRMLNRGSVRDGRHVLYWMEASCRAECNHALEHAVREANRLGKPLLACFGLTADASVTNARHCTFMLEGLRDARQALARRGIPLIVRRGEPDAVAAELAEGASLVVTDRGYLRNQRRWRERAATRIACAFVQVESDVVVPVETASDKEAYSAATLRPRIQARLAEFLVPVRATPVRHGPPTRTPESLDLDDIPGLVRDLGVDRSVPPVSGLVGGAGEAAKRLEAFVSSRLRRYDTDRNDPALDGQSGLSPYLHFGQLSPLQVALAVKARRGAGVKAFVEELVVRRELSMNFTHYNPNYDRLECLPAWCRATLHQHARDPRPTRYSPDQLEQARTHDPYWNAAQLEMVLTGKMHGYMRMYWGKKILEWTERPADAFAEAVRLNDRYELDGRDPNGYAGVAWCFGKHDRPWAERPIFGLIRYMNASGLERKFDIDSYVRRIEDLRRTDGRRDPETPTRRPHPPSRRKP
jgi:deoxyribodipyrimidine photo-lyase